jgi:hypothetical protein
VFDVGAHPDCGMRAEIMANEKAEARPAKPLSLFPAPTVPLRDNLTPEVVQAEVDVQLTAVRRAIERLAASRKVSQEALQLVMRV